ncbi:MAG: NifB/NifX family molybdenum-iron cluster-binding protein [Anaerolineae bacterium]|jgi:predicted Fe-Mo cluster-binding NifX family protein|nr:NifB/NifX family molybdenum-iron cluster-binding protein [Anaerolineae bacterium]MDH7472830.1 NifB/NifX family molybdenum-iron cluster-binding protein [Anaerolineae bacterium]
MKIVVTSNGTDLDAPTSPVFGRCSTYIFVDTESMQFEAVPNPAMTASGGAGIQAAQFIVERGAQVVLTGNVGPNAFNVFQAAGVPIYLVGESTVREAVEAYKNGQLQPASRANVQAHAGMGPGRGRRRDEGRTAPSSGPVPTTDTERAEEIKALQQAAADLRRQLAEVMERIEKLDKER